MTRTVDADGEYVEAEEGLAVVEAPQALAPTSLFGTSDPVAVIEKATVVAQALAQVLESQHLFAEIERKRYITVEGWTLLGSMLGIFPVVEWVKKIDDGFEARVLAQTRAGETVGAAEASCSWSEQQWNKREGKMMPRWKDEYAGRSMAQTRAVSKAMRLPLGFIVQLAGYASTPAEEMPRGEARIAQSAPAPHGPPQGATSGAPLRIPRPSSEEVKATITPEAAARNVAGLKERQKEIAEASKRCIALAMLMVEKEGGPADEASVTEQAEQKLQDFAMRGYSVRFSELGLSDLEKIEASLTKRLSQKEESL